MFRISWETYPADCPRHAHARIGRDTSSFEISIHGWPSVSQIIGGKLTVEGRLWKRSCAISSAHDAFPFFLFFLENQLFFSLFVSLWYEQCFRT